MTTDQQAERLVKKCRSKNPRISNWAYTDLMNLLRPLATQVRRGYWACEDHEAESAYNLAVMAVVKHYEFGRSVLAFFSVVYKRQLINACGGRWRTRAAGEVPFSMMPGAEGLDERFEHSLIDENVRHPDQDMIDSEETELGRELVQRLLDRLTDMEYEAFVRVHGHGDTYEEIAEDCKTTLKRIDNSLQRAKHKCRQLVALMKFQRGTRSEADSLSDDLKALTAVERRFLN